MTFVPIDSRRYQVLDLEGKLIGTVYKEVFTTYVDKKPKEDAFWLSYSLGCVRLPGKFRSRKAAGIALAESKGKSTFNK